jgi:hypothetical protein
VTRSATARSKGPLSHSHFRAPRMTCTFCVQPRRATFYQVKVETSGGKWEAFKRYSDFKEFHEVYPRSRSRGGSADERRPLQIVKAHHSGMAAFKFPPKARFKPFSRTVKDRRREVASTPLAVAAVSEASLR